MKYVSAEWIDDGFGGKVIKATGDDGSTWFVQSLASDVPPWPEFLAQGGEVKGDPPDDAA